jgi:hypothetical protein
MLDGRRYLEDQAGCACDMAQIGARPRVHASSYTIQLVDGVPGKAEIFLGTGKIQVDRSFWEACNDAQRAAVIAHEIAHDERPDDCERCCDARAGARLRWEGWSARAAVDGLGQVVRSRQSGAAVLAGWRAADELIQGARAVYPALKPPIESITRTSYRMPGVNDARALDFASSGWIAKTAPASPVVDRTKTVIQPISGATMTPPPKVIQPISGATVAQPSPSPPPSSPSPPPSSPSTTVIEPIAGVTVQPSTPPPSSSSSSSSTSLLTIAAALATIWLALR